MSPPTDSELVEPTWVDGAILAAMVLLFLASLTQLAWGAPPGDSIITLAVLGGAGLTFNQSRRLTAVLKRRTRRRGEEQQS